MPLRFGGALLSALGGLTVVLVIVGAAGSVAYGLARRRREIGIRLALGARRARVAGAMVAVIFAAMALAPGARLGPHEILAPIGQGGSPKPSGRTR